MAGDLVAIPQLEDAVWTLSAELHHFLRGDNLHSKALRLHHRAPRQVRATQARRESQVVLDARAKAGLSAGGLAIDHHRLQSLRGAIHRSCQPAWTSSDNSEVIELGFSPGPQANLLGQRGWTRLKHARSIGKQRQG